MSQHRDALLDSQRHQTAYLIAAVDEPQPLPGENVGCWMPQGKML